MKPKPPPPKPLPQPPAAYPLTPTGMRALADANGNRHHKDGSRCTDAYCRRAHAIPLAAKVPHAE